MNLKRSHLLRGAQTVSHSMWTKEKRSPAKGPPFSGTLEIVLISPGLPACFHSCANNSAYSKPWDQGGQSIPWQKHAALSSGVGTAPQSKSKGKPGKEGGFLTGGNGGAGRCNIIRLPGNEGPLGERSPSSGATWKWLKCLEDSSMGCVRHHFQLSARPWLPSSTFSVLPKHAVGMGALCSCTWSVVLGFQYFGKCQDSVKSQLQFG